MDILTASLLSLTLLLVLCAVLWFLTDQTKRNQSQSLLQHQQSLQSLTLQSQSSLALVAALDKAMALLSTSDPLTFQQVQVMNPSAFDDATPYDPSDEGEIARISQRSKDLAEEGDLSASERSIFGSEEFGVDAEFFTN